ncbi:MAG: C25 family cysteine peptidase [Chitinophagales bacterium]
MQRYIVVLLTFTISALVYGQGIPTTYYNEWINFDQTYYKVKLNSTGLYRINQSVLQSAGINAKGADLKLYYKGKEVPIYVSNDGDLGNNDYVEFFGEKNDGEFDTQLFQKPTWQLTPLKNLFTDTSAYFIAVESGANHSRYASTTNDISNPPAKEAFYIRNSQNVFEAIHNPGKRINVGGTATSFADFDENEGFTGSSINTTAGETSSRQNLSTPSIFFNGGEATITTKLVGINNDPFTFKDHPLTISFNGTVYQQTNFEGFDNTIETFNVPLGELKSPETEATFTALTTDNPTATNNFVVSYMHITYPSTFDFEGNRSRIFEIDNNADKYIEVTNFDGGSQPILYDITNRQRIVPIVEGSVYKFLLKQVFGGAAKRKLILANTSNSLTTRRINKIDTVQFTDFSKAENQGDYLIISHPLLMKGAVNQVERYRQYRSSAAGGNHKVVLANIEELYDQFAWGIQKHPLSVRNFINYAADKWNGQAKQLLLLGKSIEYRSTTTSANFRDCLIPTYGHSGSDVLLTARSAFSYVNQVALGRVPARTAEEAKIYLDKVIEYETLPDPCSAQDILWRKHALHIAGGTDLAEAADFVQTLSVYKEIFEDINFGGKVIHTYNKFSDDPIEEADLSNFINPGLGIINFVGHGTGNSLNVNIKALEQENYGRYPFILASSCFVGDIHNSNNVPVGMAHEFVLAPNLGSIGFLASAAVGFPVLLDQYVQGVYENFTANLYNQSIGLAIKDNNLKLSIEFGDPNSPFYNGVKFNAIFFTLTGDPAIILNPLPVPDYRVSEAGISFEPPQITTDLDSFAVNIVLQNLGKAIEDPIQVVVNRRLPDGTVQVVFDQQVPSPKYADTLQVFVQTGDADVIGGSNSFEVLIDAQNQVAELCESNNNTVKETTIFSNQLIPIFPCEFAIVANPNVTLKSSTGQPILEEYDYEFQIDTTALFNSPLLQTATVTSKAGVISWQPNVNYQNKTVYYWRNAQVPENEEEKPAWAVSSFLFEANSTNGWNQSHYYQFNRNTFNDILLDSLSRKFNYDFITNKLHIVNNRLSPDNISISLNDKVLADFNSSPSTRATCLEEGVCEGGLGFIVLKPKPILEPIVSLASERSGTLDCGGMGKYGNNHCELNDMYAIEFSTAIGSRLESMQTFMNETIEVGDYVLVYSLLNHRLSNAVPNDPIFPYVNFIEDFLQNMGIATLDGLTNNRGFIAFGRKGLPEYPANIQLTGNLSDENLVMDLEVDVRADNGSVSSPPIGPAKSWQTLSWKKDNLPTDQTNLRVYGIGENGSELINGNLATGENINISSIDALKYPFLRLELKSTDVAERTPPQLDFWKVHFEGAGELALDTKTAYSFESDTLFEGQTGSLSFAYVNAGEVDMDSVLVHYTLVNRNNVQTLLDAPRYKPLASGESYTANFSFETNGLSGSNFLLVEINPDGDQLEKKDFNNVLVIPFTVISDKINPIVDVTFDGRHIIDGDIVSAAPNILIRVKDDNPFFALNDTSDYQIVLTYPDGNGNPIAERIIPFSDPMVTFRPATQAQAAAGNNTSEIELQPNFTQNGTYEIAIDAKDRSGNDFARQAYKGSFEVITESMISNVLNYPNPFTSSTRFLLTITGSEVPEYLKIQIMTVSGKVVREITQAELGSLHVGENLTEFAWDGTDEFGDKLANGVYLYRVVSRLNGQEIKQLETNELIDGSFKNGWGKMYLMR